MEDRKTGIIPLKLLAFDMIGALLAGIGLAKQAANVDILPAAIRFAHYGPIFIVAGVALMIPLVLHILNRARDKGEATRL